MRRQVWRLQRRPAGDIADGDLAFADEDLPDPGEGEFVVAVRYLSLDPTNRIWMSDMEQYMPPVGLGEPMRGGVVGRVVKSRKPGVDEGQLMAGLGEWASHLLTDGRMMQPMPELPGISTAHAFGTFGVVGPTAWFGLYDIGRPRAGETLVVSAAAGGVGQVVGQLARLEGCRVIGIAGGAEKCRYVVDELGFDAAIDHREGRVAERLDALAPDGVDISFEQVGGPIMEAVAERLRLFGRLVLCGMIAGYNDPGMAEPPAMWTRILMRRLKVQGFILTDYAPRMAEAIQGLAGHMAAGRLKTRQDIRPGLDQAVEHVRLLYSGGNFGKLLVEVAPDGR